MDRYSIQKTRIEAIYEAMDSKIKVGRKDEYLSMRLQGIKRGVYLSVGIRRLPANIYYKAAGLLN